MKRKVFVALAVLLAWSGRDGLRAQQRQPVSSLQEDCSVTFAFTAASSGVNAVGTVTAGPTGATAWIDNRQVGCLDWLVTYNPTTTVTGLSLLFQTATDLAGAPGTASAYGGTLVSGINPNAAATSGGAVTEATGVKYAFLRLNLTILTGSGTVSGKLYGWKRRPTYVSVVSGGGCPGTVGTPCVVVGPAAEGAAAAGAPVRVAGWDGSLIRTLKTSVNGGLEPAAGSTAINDGTTNAPFVPISDTNQALNYVNYPKQFNGADWDREFVCSNSARVTLSNATRTQLIALSGTTVIRVCHIHMSTTAAEDFTISYGTGSACGTGTATLDKLLSVQGFAFDYQPTAALRAPAANALCVTQSGTQSAEVTVIYAQF